MKLRTFLILPLAFTTIAMAGCSSSGKVDLVYGQMITETIVPIEHEALATMIDEERTFIVVTSPTSNCTCWANFKTILNAYIASTHVYVYTINYSKFFDVNNNPIDTFGIDIRSSSETFAIFDEGKLVQNIAYSEKNTIFKQGADFERWMAEVVELPTMFYISKSQLDSIYTSEEAAVVYFARSNCGDCSYVDRHYLLEYGKANLNSKPLYILDCETIGIRVYENGQLTEASKIAWQEFKDEYGLSSANNEKFGYNKGYVPTFQLIKGDGSSGHASTNIVSQSVYFNDTIAAKDGAYVVEDSYYTDERLANLSYASNVTTNVLKGLALSASDVTAYESGYIAWNQDKAASYHDPLLKAFLDYALPLVSHSGF